MERQDYTVGDWVDSGGASGMYNKQTPFNENAYLVYIGEPANGKVERPVNLVVKKILIEKVAEEKGIFSGINETNGGIM